MNKTAVIFAVPGTSSDEASATLRHIDELCGMRFDNIRRTWAFTSSGVRRKLKKMNKPVQDPGEALDSLLKDGITRIAVKSLHLATGMEYKELKDLVQERQAAFERIVISTPLLNVRKDLSRTIECLLASLPAGGKETSDALLLVAHGSLQPEAQAAYEAAAILCRGMKQRVILGSLMCRPGLDDVVKECKAAGVRRLVLAPMMIAAGFSARNEIAGNSPESWQSALQREGISCTPVFKGLGDHDRIVNIWLDDVGRMLKECEKKM